MVGKCPTAEHTMLYVWSRAPEVGSGSHTLPEEP
jgi:hypothetical protein